MKQIWIVDHDAVLMAGMNITVQALNAETQLFSSPVAFLKQLSAGVKPRVVVLDFHSEGVDMIDVLRVLRSHALCAGVRVIVILNSNDSEELRHQVSKAGATMVMRRNMQARAFKALINECLRDASISQLSRCVEVCAA